MKFTTESGAWRCEYTVDDLTGALKSVACGQRRYYSEALGMWIEPEPPGRGDFYSNVGDQATAGEEDQTPSDWDAL